MLTFGLKRGRVNRTQPDVEIGPVEAEHIEGGMVHRRRFGLLHRLDTLPPRLEPSYGRLSFGSDL